jgi:hypothetical protein
LDWQKNSKTKEKKAFFIIFISFKANALIFLTTKSFSEIFRYLKRHSHGKVFEIIPLYHKLGPN